MLVSCATGVPKPAATAGTPQISWVLMYGDRDDADREFACQSGPRPECVVPASKPDAPVFSDIHFYFHGAGTETRYEGTINIGYLRQGAEAHASRINIPVKKDESMTNSSVTGIVASTPASYTVTISATATTGASKAQPLRESIPVVVK